jgi:flagellar basal body-associated protein FliL
MISNPYIIAAVVVFLIVLVIGSWYLSSSSESAAPEYDQGVESTPAVEAAPNDAMDTYDTYTPETGVNDTIATTMNTGASVNAAIVTESTTTTVPTNDETNAEDVTNVEDVVPSEQIEFINNKQSQIKTFLSTEFGFLNSLNA